MDEIGPLPFELKSEDLPTVRITYAFYSAKTGVGRSEISISGAGKVVLLEEAMLNDPNPQTLEKSIDASIVIRLLDVMQEEGFLTFEDLYRATDTPGGTRVIELVLPDRSKKVMAEQPTVNPPFERIAGAIKFATGLAVPEALQSRFFQRM